MPGGYDPELKARAIHQVTEALPNRPDPTGAVRHAAGTLGMGIKALRTCYRQARIDTAGKSSVTTDIAEENRRLRRENEELRKRTKS